MIDLSKYQFSIIYSVDVPKGAYLAKYRPPKFQKLEWFVTESGPSEYAYLDEEGDELHWKGGKHRKYCNILSFADFCDFLESQNLVVEKCHTLGSFGAPGFGMGWAPAVPFRADNSDAIQDAYVTPIPPEPDYEHQPLLPGMPEDVDIPDWEAVEAEMWAWFDDSGYGARDRAEAIAEEHELVEA